MAIQRSAFIGHCGECKSGYYFIKSEIGLQPGDDAKLVLGDTTDLSSCIKANDGATVYGVSLVSNAGFYDYRINIDCKGPSGLGGSMYLAFQDKSGDVYYISIYSSTRSVHTLSYNSENPAIIAILWSNVPFIVKLPI